MSEPTPVGTIVASVAAAAVGVTAVGAYAATSGAPVVRVAAVGLMTAAAACAVGALVGFLFGVPRALARADTAGARYAANTNLEQVSDWLTKILVGVGLTQLGAIRSGGGDLVRALAPAFGDGPAATAFPATLLVYFLVVGFLAAWLMTRRFLGAALKAADDAADAAVALRAAEDAEAVGDTAKAAELRATAVSLLAPAAESYDKLRATLPSGPRRTAAMERVVAQARGAAFDPSTDAAGVRAVYERGGEGARLAALATMEVRPELASATLIARSIARSQSAFEQYHALLTALAAVDSLDEAGRQEIAAAIEAQRTGGHLAADSDRRRLSDRVLARLGQQPVT